MRHIDLFSGIGGFALAIDEIWPEVEHIFCEIDPFCQAVLKKHWKGSEIYGDIRELTADTDTAGQQDRIEECRWEETSQGTGERSISRQSLRGIDLLTGGFPCQPFSQAGKRRGTSDNRFLWPEMLRVIHEFRPSWVIAENVRGLLTIEQGVVFEQVCLDLEGESYEVQPFVIPAVAVNAPHRRDRVWIVAHSKCPGCHVRVNSSEGSKDDRQHVEEDRQQRGRQGVRVGENDTNGWDQNWLEVATELCGVDDGLPAGVDTFTLTKSRHRVERLKSLGNAIVPQVAVEIMKAIKTSELVDSI